jgi:hypothetical protein
MNTNTGVCNCLQCNGTRPCLEGAWLLEVSVHFGAVCVCAASVGSLCEGVRASVSLDGLSARVAFQLHAQAKMVVVPDTDEYHTLEVLKKGVSALHAICTAIRSHGWESKDFAEVVDRQLLFLQMEPVVAPRFLQHTRLNSCAQLVRICSGVTWMKIVATSAIRTLGPGFRGLSNPQQIFWLDRGRGDLSPCIRSLQVSPMHSTSTVRHQDPAGLDRGGVLGADRSRAHDR